MTRRRLLAVSGIAPWPMRGGFSLRTAHLLEHLASTWDISLVLATEAPPEGTKLDTARAHEVIHAPPCPKWKPVPAFGADFSSLRETVDTVAAKCHPAAVLLFTGMEFLAFGKKGFPAVGDRVDCGALERWRYIRYARFFRRFGAAYESLVQARYERQVVRSLDATIVAGEDDRKALERLSGRETIHVVPNGVDAAPAPDFTTESSRPTVALTGTLSYYANVDAAVHFARDMWPAIRTRLGDARLVIAGRNPSRRVLALAELPGVEIRPNVGEMRRVIEESWVAVAPMRCGAGIKNKILEAWAVGRPAIITPIAANGLYLNPEMESLVADGGEAFSKQVVSLLEDPELRHRRGREAHTIVRTQHSWEQSAREVSRLLDSVARDTPGRHDG